MLAHTEFGPSIFDCRLRKNRTAIKQADDIKVTICITPRERFSSALYSLRNIIDNTEFPYHLVYIDTNSPAHIGQSIAATCAEYGFDYIRIEV